MPYWQYVHKGRQNDEVTDQKVWGNENETGTAGREAAFKYLWEMIQEDSGPGG